MVALVRIQAIGRREHLGVSARRILVRVISQRDMGAHLEAVRCIAILPSVCCGLTAWFVHKDEEKEKYNNERTLRR